MPSKERADVEDVNLFRRITEDIDPGIMRAKQEEFDTMADAISNVFKGNVKNFYYEEYPEGTFTPEQANQEL